MLVFDFKSIGNKLLSIRKKCGLTQSQVAEAAGLSDRTYADIERGTVNMKLETLLCICEALRITPDDILTQENQVLSDQQQQLAELFQQCTPLEQRTALELLAVYLYSLHK